MDVISMLRTHRMWEKNGGGTNLIANRTSSSWQRSSESICCVNSSSSLFPFTCAASTSCLFCSSCWSNSAHAHIHTHTQNWELNVNNVYYNSRSSISSCDGSPWTIRLLFLFFWIINWFPDTRPLAMSFSAIESILGSDRQTDTQEVVSPL